MVSYAVLPHCGEDSFAVRSGERGGLYCVADGCGGLGSRRYRALGDKTGAYLASRLAVDAVVAWYEENRALPKSPGEGARALAGLQESLQAKLRGFAEKNKLWEDGSRIVGSMQRLLPSTLCAAVTEAAENDEGCCFLWAGDSRGYGLDGQGLHQFTRDDVRPGVDAFDCLYRDLPLCRCLNADEPVLLHMRRVRLGNPGVLICATDGAFGCLRSPMEFEMLLLSTMQAAGDEAGWQRKLEMALRRLACDDATVLCRPRGFESYGQMKRYFAPRLETLKKTWITPVRRRGRDEAFARERWQSYRPAYDHTEGAPDDKDDWRI